jgi:hypothetical protein
VVQLSAGLAAGILPGIMSATSAYGRRAVGGLVLASEPGLLEVWLPAVVVLDAAGRPADEIAGRGPSRRRAVLLSRHPASILRPAGHVGRVPNLHACRSALPVGGWWKGGEVRRSSAKGNKVKSSIKQPSTSL